MKKAIIAALALLAMAWPQVTTRGQILVNHQVVTWTTGANTGKTRIRFWSPDSNAPNVYLDTSSTGQTGAWKRIDNGADSCSQAFNIASDTNATIRPVYENRIWQKVKTASDSGTYTYRIQTRERVFNTSTQRFFWTDWTKSGTNVGYTDLTVLDSVIMPTVTSASNVSQYKFFQVAGSQARLCPDSFAGSGKSVGDSTIVDSIRVYVR